VTSSPTVTATVAPTESPTLTPTEPLIIETPTETASDASTP
jgi:hypothetical protein